MLPPETERVWQFLKDQPALSGFVLIGGSALALRIKHRISEDLDLAYPEMRLPRNRLESLLRVAAQSGLAFDHNDNEAAVWEFLQGAMELRDYQQDYLVNGRVKVSFFSPEPPLAKVISSRPEPVVRVASLAELFKTKCLVSACRSKTRDWLDLYVLMSQHGFSVADYESAFREAGIESQADIGLARLCSGNPQRDDEGYIHLLSDAPKLEEMTAFFRAGRDERERRAAAEAARQRKPGQC